MGVSYKKLFKLMIDRDMKKKDLQEAAGLGASSIEMNVRIILLLLFRLFSKIWIYFSIFLHLLTTRSNIITC